MAKNRKRLSGSSGRLPTSGGVQRRVIRYPGIKRHARELGVTHPHLWRVLVGERRSPRLEAAYRALVAAESYGYTRR